MVATALAVAATMLLSACLGPVVSPRPAVPPSSSATATPDAQQSIPDKAAWEAQLAQYEAENAAKAADPVMRAKGQAEKEAIAAQAAAEAAAAPPLTLQDVCQEGALPAEAPPGTHGDTFISKGGWGQIVGNECISVYVGQAGSDHPNDGAVFIVHTRDRANARGMFGDVEQINVPGSGALTITGTGPGGKLYLTSASGETYTVHGQSNQVEEGTN